MDYFQLCPDTVLIHVFQFVPFFDLIQNCALVCRKWNEISRCRSVMKTKEVIIKNVTIDGRCIANLIELGIWHIELSGLKINNTNALSIKENNLKVFSVQDIDCHFVKQILLLCPHITELNLKSISINDDMINIIKANGVLEKLELDTVEGISTQVCSIKQSSTCQSLRKFIVASTHITVIENILSSCPNITDLILYYVKIDKLKTSLMLKEPLAFKKLKKLYISYVDRCILERILASCGNITDIVLELTEFNENICQLILANSQLETLTLRQITGKVKTPVNSKCFQSSKNLKEVHAWKIDSDVLECILSCYRHVTLLELEFVTINDPICQLIISNTGLETLLLDGIEPTFTVDKPVHSKYYLEKYDTKKLRDLHVCRVDVSVLEYFLSWYSTIKHLTLMSLTVNESICALITANSELEKLKLVEIVGKNIKKRVKIPINAKKMIEIRASKVDANVLDYFQLSVQTKIWVPKQTLHKI